MSTWRSRWAGAKTLLLLLCAACIAFLPHIAATSSISAQTHSHSNPGLNSPSTTSLFEHDDTTFDGRRLAAVADSKIKKTLAPTPRDGSPAPNEFSIGLGTPDVSFLTGKVLNRVLDIEFRDVGKVAYTAINRRTKDKHNKVIPLVSMGKSNITQWAIINDLVAVVPHFVSTGAVEGADALKSAPPDLQDVRALLPDISEVKKEFKDLVRVGRRLSAPAPLGFANNNIDPTKNDPVVPAKGAWKVLGITGSTCIAAGLSIDNQLVCVERPKRPNNPYLPDGQGSSTVGSRFNIDIGVYTIMKYDDAPFCSCPIRFIDGKIGFFGGEAYSDAAPAVADGRNIVRKANVPGDNKAVKIATMGSTRWYPSCLTLGNGNILVVGGSFELMTVGGGLSSNPPNRGNPTYQVFNQYTNTWVENEHFLQQLQDGFPLDLYPLLFLVPDYTAGLGAPGKVLIIARQKSKIYSVNKGTLVADNNIVIPDVETTLCFPNSAAGLMLPLEWNNNWLGTIIVVGGSTIDAAYWGTPASTKIRKLTLQGNNPQWQVVNMPQPRVMPSAILLPDGTVFICNGGGVGQGQGGPGSGSAFNPQTVPTIYDPKSNTFKIMADSKISRLYHSGAQLMPGGEVLVFGNEITLEYRGQQFTPPYLLAGNTRPQLVRLPASTTWGATITLGYVSSGSPITRVVLYGSGGTTHGLTFDERQVVLKFTVGHAGRKLKQIAGGIDIPPVKPIGPGQAGAEAQTSRRELMEYPEGARRRLTDCNSFGLTFVQEDLTWPQADPAIAGAANPCFRKAGKTWTTTVTSKNQQYVNAAMNKCLGPNARAWVNTVFVYGIATGNCTYFTNNNDATHGTGVRDHTCKMQLPYTTCGNVVVPPPPPADNELHVTLPPNPTILPPGYYMVYIIDSKNTPAVAKWIQIK